MSNPRSQKSIGTTHRLPSLPKGLMDSYYAERGNTPLKRKPLDPKEQRRFNIAHDLRRWTPERVRAEHKCSKDLIADILATMRIGGYGGLRGTPIWGLREDRADS